MGRPADWNAIDVISEDGYFGDRVAATYDESSADMFEPGVVDAVHHLATAFAQERPHDEAAIGEGRGQWRWHRRCPARRRSRTLVQRRQLRVAARLFA